MSKTDIRNASDADLISELRRRASESCDLKQKALEALAGEQVRPDLMHNLAPEATQKCELTSEQAEALLSALKARFEAHPERHEGIEWDRVKASLEADPVKLWSLQKLEETGGEPDVFMADKEGFVIGDCSAESPEGRRNVVFDREAEEFLEKNYLDVPFSGNAADLVAEWAVEFMDEKQYRYLQTLGVFDQKTNSWLRTPADIRKSDHALHGYYTDNAGVQVRQFYPYDPHNGRVAFRCVLSVNWA